MSDELSAIVRAAARAEATAAEREFPYSSATLGRFVGDVRRRRAAGGAMLAVASVAVVGMAALGLGWLGQTAPPAVFPSPPTSSSASPDSSTTPTPTVEPSTPSPSLTPSASSTPTTTPSLHTTAAPRPSKTPTAAVPGAVTFVKAGSGGGSGEIALWWDAIANATGYRVYRSDSPNGPFVRSASINLTTGVTTLGANVYNLWSPPANQPPYPAVPPGATAPQHFEYIEVTNSDPHYFQVTAFNAGGEGPRSVVVCGRPIGFPAC